MRFVLLLAAACALVPAAAAVSVELDAGVFVVKGWTPQDPPSGGWSTVFRVFAGDGADVPPLLGDYAVRDGNLTFRPRYAPTPGLRLRAVFRTEVFTFTTAARVLTPKARVVRVYPNSSELPANQLKFYIEFSAPMSRGLAWKYIHLLASDGAEVELPFLEIEQEMWDADAKRLTVLFDPGRIKRGVRPLEEIGPAIEAGHSYTLLIDREWADAENAPLVESHRKNFRVIPADRQPVNPAMWKIGSVMPGSRESLVVRFPEPLDAALAVRLIRVRGVAGRATLANEEREWRFEPDRPWSPGRHALEVDAALEDLAGNKVGRPFDVDIFDRVSRRVTPEVVTVPFRVGTR
jgi:hypothetical protein